MERERTEQLYTLGEVKSILQIGIGRIQALIESGELEAFSLDAENPDSTRAWRVSASSLNEFLDNRKIGIGVDYDRDYSNA